MKWEWMNAAWTALNNKIIGRSSLASAVQKRLILVAEGDRALRRDLRDVLRDQRYRTIEACDGAHAVRIGARCHRPIHLLMTAVRLPDLMGWELGELLRLDHPAVDVVYIAHDREEWWRLGRKSFKSLILQVPFRRESVLEVVRRGLHADLKLNSRLRLVG